MSAVGTGCSASPAVPESRPPLRTNWRKKAILMFPILAVIFFLAAKVFIPVAYRHLVREDSLLETAQAIMYFLSFAVALGIAVRFRRRGLRLHALAYLVLSLGFLFIFFEELSWGQRIFHIASPDFFRVNNWQREITLHNIRGLNSLLHHAFLVVGLYGAMAWLFVRRMKAGPDSLLRFVVPDWYLSPYFFVTFGCYFYLEYAGPFAWKVLRIRALRVENFFTFKDQEPAEFLLALGFLLFVLVNERRSKGVLPREGDGNEK